MNKDILLYVVLFIALLLVQVLICNHIALFNVAVPIIFIYFIIHLPVSINTSILLTLSFLLGLSNDLFSDTLGVNALACTLIAIMKKPILYAYIPRDDRTKNIIPSLNTLGWSVFSKFLLTFSVIYCVLMFTIEIFNISAIKEITVMSLSSGLLSFIVMLGIDSLIGIQK